MNNPYTLVIIDVQTGFASASNAILQRNISREIRQAIKQKMPILFVEYEHHGETHTKLTNLVKNYNNKYTVFKNSDDGALQIADIIRRKKLPRETKICGVNTSYCVLSTVTGLTNRFRKINVVKDACYCQYAGRAGWNLYAKENGLSDVDSTLVCKIERVNFFRSKSW